MNNNKTLFYSDRVLSLWFLSIVTLAPVLVCIFLVQLLTPEQMIIDFGTVIKGRFFQVGLVAFSGILFYSMIWLSGKYVIRIDLQENHYVKITTWSLFLISKQTTYPPEAWQGLVTYHDGRSYIPTRPTVYASYLTIRPFKKEKLIIDMQGIFPQGEEALLDIVQTI